MARTHWMEGDVIRGLAAAALIVALPEAASGAGAGSTGGAGDREARRRWALARMDEMAGERLRCQLRFRTSPEIRECQAEFERRHRAYNEIYMEASRD